MARLTGARLHARVRRGTEDKEQTNEATLRRCGSVTWEGLGECLVRGEVAQRGAKFGPGHGAQREAMRQAGEQGDKRGE